MNDSSIKPVFPTLETSRLVLRAHRESDLPSVAAMWADPRVTHHIGGKPFSRAESWWKILRYAGHWSLLGFGYWAVEEKSSRRFIGEIGFADFKRDMEPPIEGIPEAGWVMAPEAHGKGLASEALTAALAWGDAHLAGDRTFCIIGPGNAPSIRLAERLGYREIRRTKYGESSTIVFERPRVII